MPRNENGTWTPPPHFAGWWEFKHEFVERAVAECRAAATLFILKCERMRENPSSLLRRWAWAWKVSKFENGRLIPGNWPDAMTAGDWKSLAMFAENEAANAGA